MKGFGIVTCKRISFIEFEGCAYEFMVVDKPKLIRNVLKPFRKFKRNSKIISGSRAGSQFLKFQL